MTSPEAMRTIVPRVFIGISTYVFIVNLCIRWRERQHREAQRQHLQHLRTQAEADLAAEIQSRGGHPHA
jgi:hypothetical protein